MINTHTSDQERERERERDQERKDETIPYALIFLPKLATGYFAAIELTTYYTNNRS